MVARHRAQAMLAGRKWTAPSSTQRNTRLHRLQFQVASHLVTQCQTASQTVTAVPQIIYNGTPKSRLRHLQLY
jgi:hypothetical protein